jgi:hypothetical protein
LNPSVLWSTFSSSSDLQNRGASLPIPPTDAISPAFEHAKKQLFRPFRFGQWARLAFVGILAGEMSSGGGGNYNFNLPWPNHDQGSAKVLGTVLPPQVANHPAMLAGLIALLAVVGLCLFLLFLYIGSVMRFILFDSIIAKECHIRKGWARRRRHGARLFVWQILLMLASFAALLIFIGIPVAGAWAVGWIRHPREHLLPLISGGIALLVIFLALVIVMAVVEVMTKDFVVPQMALEEISAITGWRRLWPLLKEEKGGYAGYIGMKILLAIGAGLLFGVITLIVFVLLLIPIGGLAVGAVLGGKAAGLTWSVYTITLAVVAACIAVAVLVFALALISVPVIVFFPAYSIYFFAPRYAPLASLLWPQPPS